MTFCFLFCKFFHHHHCIAIILQGGADLALAPTESRGVPVNIRIPAGAGEKGSNKIYVTIADADNPNVQVSEKAVFFVPR